jgi:hypothetical protein
MITTWSLAIIIFHLMLTLILLSQTFTFLENMLDTLNYHVILIWNFNVPGFDWNYSLPFCNSHHYIKEKGDVILSAICFLRLNEHNYL